MEYSDETVRPTKSPTESPTSAPTSPIKPDISIDTFRSMCIVASGGFVLLFLVFSLLRRLNAARKVYAPRLFTARIPPRVPPKSVVGWLKSLVGRKVSQRVLDEVGLDAFMMNRLIAFCATAFLYLAPFCLLVLIPLYASEAPVGVKGFKKYTIQSLLEADASQLWIAVGMAYWNSAVVLFLLHAEYKAYMHHRHEFLRRAAPQSYTVLVERIPKKLNSRPALLHYFRKVFGNRVLAAEVVETNPILNYAVKKRQDVVTKLERALYVLENSGKRPWRLYFPWVPGQIRHKTQPLGVTEDDEEIVMDHDAYAAALHSNLSSTSPSASNSAVHIRSAKVPPAKSTRENDEDSEDEHSDSDSVDEREQVDVSNVDRGRNESRHGLNSKQIVLDESLGHITRIDDSDTDDEDRQNITVPSVLDQVTTGNGTTAQSSMFRNGGRVSEEEEAFLQEWQHNMESGLAGQHLRMAEKTALKKKVRKNHCLWLLARLNICMYIDAVKSYEKELSIWNRRVKRLQQKAEKKRQKADAEAIASVVEPSRQIIRDQFRVRMKRERRIRRANGRSSSASSIRLRKHLSRDSNTSAGTDALRKQETENQDQQQQQQQQQHQGSPDRMTSTSSLHSNSFAHVEKRDSRMSGRGLVGSFGSHRSSSAALASRLQFPWDDGRSTLFQALLSDGRHSTGHGVEAESEGGEDADSYRRDDESSHFFDEEDYLWDDDNDEEDDETGLFEHAGFDDILRYAVDQNERTSAFVTFSTLTTTMCAAQSVVDRPLKMSICMAPDPRDILWENLGLSLPVLALSTWVIRALLVALVLVFGTLSASLAALTNLTALTKVWPWLKEWLYDHEEWAVVFQQVTPMVMVILYNLVPPIINFLLKLQRRRSVSECQVEFFRIYFHFLLIQVFLFYTIAGSLLQNIREIINNPLRFLGLLGKALPSNELFFLQYLVTRCFLLSLDLLRLSDICIAFLRGIFKSSRTARERRTPCCGWHTIDHPNGGNIERTISNICLCFAIALSYSVICPAMCLVALLYFSMALIVYRNQLLYVYTHEREFAGQLFPFVFRALITGVLLFQLIMMGFFLVNGSASSMTLLIPLLFLTLSFLLFCENAYESSSRFLPLGDAAELDIINGFRKDVPMQYKHPSSLAPAKLVPEPVDTDSFRTYRRASFSISGGEDISRISLF